MAELLTIRAYAPTHLGPVRVDDERRFAVLSGARVQVVRLDFPTPDIVVVRYPDGAVDVLVDYRVAEVVVEAAVDDLSGILQSRAYALG